MWRTDLRAFFLLIVAFSALSVRPGAAQEPEKLDVRQAADLYFGRLLAGVSTTVGPLDPDAGTFEIYGIKGTEISIEWLLPTDLVGDASGELLPVTFGPLAAAYSSTNLAVDALLFDPAFPRTVLIDERGKAITWIGGTVVPTFGLAADRYSAPITIIVSTVANE